MNLNRGGLFWRNIITRPLSLSVLSGKDDKLLPGDINKFVRVFGFKNEATSIWAGNVLLSHRRRLRRALAGFCFTPLYLLPFFTDEVWIPVIGGNYSLDVFTILAGLFAFNFYSLAIIRDEKPLYPYVHKVLFNPYDGAVLLMRERWSSVTAPFNRKRPELEMLYIPHQNNKNYKPVGTTLPTGMVLQESDIEFKDGQEVKGHAGFVHSDVMLDQVAFDNYVSELLESPLMNEMISIRFAQDRVFNAPDPTFGSDTELIAREKDSIRFEEARKRRKDFEDRMKHPTLAKKQ